MPNVGVSQANATAHRDRALQPDRKALMLLDIATLATSSKAYTRLDGGYTSAGARLVTNWELSGVKFDEVNRNTDADGRLWVRIAANGGNWDINVYKTRGAISGNKVMSATAVAAGATITFTAENSSGMTGTATLSYFAAALAADTFAVQVYLGWTEMDRQIFSGQLEDPAIITAHATLNQQIGRAIDGFARSMARLAEQGGHLQQIIRVWQVPTGTGFLDKRSEVNDEAVEVFVGGAFEQMRQNHDANTAEQKVAPTTIAAGSVTESIQGGGDIAVTVGTIGENIEPGLVQAVCEEDELPFQRFRISFTPSDGTGPIVGRNLATVGYLWDDPDIPVQLTLANVYAKTGDGSNLNLAAATAFAFQGITSSNSDDGLLYWKILSSSSSWIVYFYKDSNRTQLVAQTTATATGAAFTATQQNRSGLTVTGTIGSAPVTTTTGTIDMQPLKKGTSTTAADQFWFSVTRTAKGRIQEAARELHGWKWYSATGATAAASEITEANDGSNLLATWVLTGIRIGENTSSDGKLYVSLTDESPGAGQATIALYSDSGRTQKVAEGSGANSTTVTLAATNGSGLSGTVALAAPAANDTDIELTLSQPTSDAMIVKGGAFLDGNP